VLQINVYYVNKPPPCLVKRLVVLKETGPSRAKTGLKKGFYDENCEGFSQLLPLDIFTARTFTASIKEMRL
jgi:hypothetical protein